MRNQLKTILPTLRERFRYVAFKIISEGAISYSDLEAAIWNQIFDFFGEYGASKTSAWLIKNLYDEKSQTAVIRCNNKSVQQIIGCLGLISRLGDTRVTIKILKVSGTIKGLGLNKPKFKLK